jgi:hypothetical protein
MGVCYNKPILLMDLLIRKIDLHVSKCIFKTLSYKASNYDRFYNIILGA